MRIAQSSQPAARIQSLKRRHTERTRRGSRECTRSRAGERRSVTDRKEEADQNEDEDEGREEGGRTKDELAFLRGAGTGERLAVVAQFAIRGLQTTSVVGS